MEEWLKSVQFSVLHCSLRAGEYGIEEEEASQPHYQSPRGELVSLDPDSILVLTRIVSYMIQLASSVVISHSPILILCLALSLSSALLTLPFLAILSNLLSSTNLSFYSKLTSGFVLVTWVWTLSIIRGIQRVTVAGVVGSWYFDRHEESHPSAIEVTNKSFERATGPSLGWSFLPTLFDQILISLQRVGTVIGASFVTSLFSSLSYFARQSRAVLRSAHFPTLLSPLTYLVPILAMISGSLEIFGGYCLCYTGLTGDDLVSSARRTKDLLLANRTVGLGDSTISSLSSSIVRTGFIDARTL